MICPDCNREHCHDPGEFYVITVFHSPLFPNMLVAYADDPNGPDKVLGDAVSGYTNKEIEDKIHEQFPNKSLHWHWPGDVPGLTDEELNGIAGGAK